MAQELPFDPFPFLDGPHYQTIINSMYNLFFEPDSTQKLVSLPDGDKISLEVTTPKNWKNTDLTVLLVHGLCGSHKVPNLIRMAKKLESLHIRAIRFNMRGCGSGRGLAKEGYHGGSSEDLFEAIKVLKKETPESPIILIGFSLGGNIVLKLAGELGSVASQFLKEVIAISPPVDLYSSILMLGNTSNAMYERYFYRMLRSDIMYREKKFNLPKSDLPRDLKLYEFDQIYTAPRCGFKDVLDYYERCSAISFIEQVDLPCKILTAQDDPIVSSCSLDGYTLSSDVHVFKTQKGGHFGYLGNPKDEKGFHWLDSLLLDWILGKN
jgi:predicted alpha/beta-fold hydrolase